MQVMELTSPKTIRDLLERYNFRLRKRWGQNFLADANIISKIARGAEITSRDAVVEIGPGLGVLTRKLAEDAGRVIAIEIDRNLLPILGETLQDKENVSIVNGDALEMDLDRLVRDYAGTEYQERGYKVAANLPYYITTPILMHLLESSFNITTLVVMVQDEVARRMTARPGSKDYGALSVAVQFYTTAEIMGKVSRNVFIPRPEVGSAVVKLQRRSKPAVNVDNRKLFFFIVRAAFSQRRKTLLNSLSGADPAVSKELWSDIIKAAGIDPLVRGENLGMDEFASLALAYKEKKDI